MIGDVFYFRNPCAVNAKRFSELYQPSLFGYEIPDMSVVLALEDPSTPQGFISALLDSKVVYLPAAYLEICTKTLNQDQWCV
tara:strand:- start:307 stop:552 length:246 start_codon:yes stop_codon:yes gene_type:complete